MRIEQIGNCLPDTFQRLLDSASGEGVRNMDLLWEGWQSSAQRFDNDGAALFGAFDGRRLVGVGGVTPETGYAEPAMRMRRFYVLPAARRSGAGRRLTQAAMAQGFAHAAVLTCNARATLAAGLFWEAMGFAPVDLPDITHICRRG